MVYDGQRPVSRQFDVTSLYPSLIYNRQDMKPEELDLYDDIDVLAPHECLICAEPEWIKVETIQGEANKSDSQNSLLTLNNRYC